MYKKSHNNLKNSVKFLKINIKILKIQEIINCFLKHSYSFVSYGKCSNFQ